MKHVTSLVVVLTLCLCAVSSIAAMPAVLTGPVTNTANGHVYYLLENANWTESQAKALELGGNLVTVNDAAEHNWIYSSFGNYSGVARMLWIGLTDKDQEGTFTWIDGDLSGYRNWSGGEPNNFGNEDYGCIFPPGISSAGLWNDGPDVTSLSLSGGPTFLLHGVVEVTTAPPPPLPAILSGPVTNSANGHAYYLLEGATWTVSQAKAVSMGGNLATVNDATEDAWIFNAFANFGGSPRALWIGLNDAAQEGTFVWADGDPSPYRHWSSGEPNNFGGDEDYVSVLASVDSRAGQWSDAPNVTFLTYASPPTNITLHGVVEIATIIPACLPAPADLTAWWRLEGNAADGVGSNNGTLNGGPTFGSAAVNQGLELDGINDYVQVPAAPGVDVGTGTGLTIELWVKPTDLTKGNPMVEWSGSGLVTCYLWHSETYGGSGGAGSVLFRLKGAGPGDALIGTIGGLLQSNVFHHVAATYDKTSGLMRVYVDGQMIEDFSAGTFTPDTARDLFLGARPSESGRFKGTMDEVSLYNRALSGAEIQAIHQAGASGKCSTPPPACTTVPPGLISWWRGENSGQDYTAANQGLVQSGVSFAPGKVGQAFVLDGTPNSYVEIQTTNGLNFTGNTPMSVEFWAYRTGIASVSGNLHFLGKRAPGCGSFQFQVASDPTTGGVQFGASGGSAGTGVPMPLGTWVHIAGTYDGTTFRIYTNGVLSGSNAGSLGPQNDARLRLGNSSGECEGFVGLLDEVAMYNRALTGAEVQAIFSADSNGKCATILAPFITQQPQSQSVLAGSGVSFSVTAGGTAPLAYQWFFGASPLAGETNTTLNLSNVQPGAAGTYTVVVSNALNSVISAGAVLTVFAVPPADGLTLVVPNYLETNDFNFGAANLSASLRMQEVYGASQFPAAPILIKELRYRPNNVGQTPFNTVISNIQINLSTTPKAVNGLSSVFSNNIGPDNTLVVSGAVPISSAVIGPAGGPLVFDIIIPLTTPFIYDPAQGNLLVDVRNVSGAPLAARLSGNGSSDDAGNRVLRPLNPNATTGIVDTGVAALQVIYNLATNVAPYISQQPQSRAVLAGSNASFSVTANGTAPLAYQWFFGAAPLGGQTSATLNLANVQPASAGGYSVVVANSFGAVTSAVATLSVTLPPARVQVTSITTNALGPVSVPVVLVANGNEAAVGFTLEFNPALLAYSSVTLGGGAPGGSLLVNAIDSASGRVGIAVSLPAGTFATGTQQVATVNFNIAPVASNTVTALTLGDAPIVREVANSLGVPLTAQFLGGGVSIVAVDHEGDVTPRPTGNRSLTVSDWVQVGRFVAGLDTPANSAEFQRADTAPRSNRGNGNLGATDWVQAGRYAAGLDPVTAAGGPTGGGGSVVSSGKAAASGGTRELRVVSTNLTAGQIGTVDIVINAAGDESALTFSLSYDAAQMSFAGATLGAGSAGGTLNVNNSQAGTGRVGLALSLPIGNTLTAGTQQVVRASFHLLQSAAGDSPLTFASTPVLQEISDPLANALTAGYADGLLKLDGPIPTLTITQNGGSVLLMWPSDIAGYSVEESPTMLVPAAWNAVGAPPSVIGGSNVVVVPATNEVRFFRLRK